MPAPKLLPKKLITASLAAERKQEIDKGMKIAKAVDALREERQTAEKELNEYRESAIKSVQASIDGKIQERDALRNEVESLQLRRQELLVPLDAEWEKVRSRESVVEEQIRQAYGKVQEADALILSLLEREKGIEAEEGRIGTLKREAESERQAAADLRQEGEAYASRMRHEADQVIKEAQERERIVSLRETASSSKESSLVRWEKKLERDEKALLLGEMKLKAGWERLQKTAERIRSKQT